MIDIWIIMIKFLISIVDIVNKFKEVKFIFKKYHH